MALLQCTLNINIKLVQYGRPIAYKYLVYSPSCGSKEDSDLFEYIRLPQPPPGVNHINRCLIVQSPSKGNFNLILCGGIIALRAPNFCSECNCL